MITHPLLLSHQQYLYYERIYKQEGEPELQFPLDDLTIEPQMWSSDVAAFYDHIVMLGFLDISCGRIIHNHGIHTLK